MPPTKHTQAREVKKGILQRKLILSASYPTLHGSVKKIMLTAQGKYHTLMGVWATIMGGSIISAIKKAACSPLGMALLLWGVMLCLASPLFYHGDDLTFCHALYLNDAPSPHWLHPSYLLSYPLCRLASLIPWVNVYLLYLYALLIGSAAAVLHVTRAGGNGGDSLRIAGLIVVCYIIFQVPMHMEYAWISFLSAGCGCMLLFHHLYRGETGLRKLWPGLLLFAGGAVLRFDSCLGFAPFIAAASLFCPHAGNTLPKLSKTWLIPAACVLFLIGIYTLQPLPAEGQWQGDGNLVGINRVRMDFVDYADRSEADKSAEYRNAGASPACLNLLENYFCCDEAWMTTDRWARLGSIRRQDNPNYVWGVSTWKYMGNLLLLCHKHFLLLLCLAVWGVWMRRGKWRLYPIAMAAVYFFCIALCCAKGRCHLTPIMSLAYFYVPMLLIPCGLRKNFPCFLTPKRTAYIMTVAALMTIGAILAVNHARLLPLGGFRHHYVAAEARSALEEWLRKNPGCIALADCYAYRDLGYPDAPLFRPKAPYIPRLVELGNWPSTLPYRRIQRESYGITNEILSLSASERVRLVIGPKGFEYLRPAFAYLLERYGIELAPQKECQLSEQYAIYKLATPGNRNEGKAGGTAGQATGTSASSF